MARTHHCRDYQDLSQQGAARVIAALKTKHDSLLCVPTGGSPAGMYRELAREVAQSPGLFRNLRAIKLDEWLGVPAGDAASCEHFLRNRFLDPLAIAAERYLSFDSESSDPVRECARISAELARRGPIDLCILGLGRNGHVALIEPGPVLELHCHVAKLSDETLRHAMMSARKPKPEFGLTLGIGDILAARKILLLVTGAGKERVIAKFLEARVTTDLPATLLWLHQDLEVLLDDSSR